MGFGLTAIGGCIGSDGKRADCEGGEECSHILNASFLTKLYVCSKIRLL